MDKKAVEVFILGVCALNTIQSAAKCEHIGPIAGKWADSETPDPTKGTELKFCRIHRGDCPYFFGATVVIDPPKITQPEGEPDEN